MCENESPYSVKKRTSETMNSWRSPASELPDTIFSFGNHLIISWGVVRYVLTKIFWYKLHIICKCRPAVEGKQPCPLVLEGAASCTCVSNSAHFVFTAFDSNPQFTRVNIACKLVNNRLFKKFAVQYVTPNIAYRGIRYSQEVEWEEIKNSMHVKTARKEASS